MGCPIFWDSNRVLTIYGSSYLACSFARRLQDWPPGPALDYILLLLSLSMMLGSPTLAGYDWKYCTYKPKLWVPYKFFIDWYADTYNHDEIMKYDWKKLCGIIPNLQTSGKGTRKLDQTFYKPSSPFDVREKRSGQTKHILKRGGSTISHGVYGLFNVWIDMDARFHIIMEI